MSDQMSYNQTVNTNNNNNDTLFSKISDQSVSGGHPSIWPKPQIWPTVFLSVKFHWNPGTSIHLHTVYSCVLLQWQRRLIAVETV